MLTFPRRSTLLHPFFPLFFVTGLIFPSNISSKLTSFYFFSHFQPLGTHWKPSRWLYGYGPLKLYMCCQRTLHHKILYFRHCSPSPVDENLFTILDSLVPSFQILHSSFTKSSFESWDFAANKLTLSCSSCSQHILRGPKHVTFSGWRVLVTCGGNFMIITLPFMAFSMTGNVIWVMGPSKSSNSDLSFTIFIKISNHSVNTSQSIHPKYWKQTFL